MRAFAIRSRIKPPHMGLVSQFVIVLLVIALMGAMAIEPTRQLLEQRELVSGMRKDLRQIETSNHELKERIHRLNDPDFIEQRARAQIGLVREGEITYVVMPPSKSTTKAGKKKAAKAKKQKKVRRETAAAKAAAPVAADDPGFLGGVLDFIGL